MVARVYWAALTCCNVAARVMCAILPCYAVVELIGCSGCFSILLGGYYGVFDVNLISVDNFRFMNLIKKCFF